jgi:molybdopterin synthase sulfur carrier subunit
MALVNIHSSLARFTNHQKLIELTIDSVGNVIGAICQRYPALTNRMLTAQGELTPYINIYINGKNLNQCNASEKLANDTRVDVLTALVGG